MNWFSRAAAVPALLFFATLHFAVSAHAVDTVTEPEKRLFLGIPQQCAFLQAENLLLMANGGGVYAFDAASGAQRWHRYLVSPRGYQGVTFGKRQVLGWSVQGVFLLDAATGRETWWRRDSQCGEIYSARLSPDESRVVTICDQGCLLYGVTDRTQRVLPDRFFTTRRTSQDRIVHGGLRSCRLAQQRAVQGSPSLISGLPESSQKPRFYPRKVKKPKC